MRDKVNVFYYPGAAPASWATIKKSILLFDELHFIDRPSFTFGKFGTIASASPLRSYEQSFRDEGIGLYVHTPDDGPVRGEFLDRVVSDVNDLEFLKRFQNGLAQSATFCSQQNTPGNYGEVGDQVAIARAVARVNLDTDLSAYAKPADLFYDDSVEPFRFKTEAERAKHLITKAVVCSAMINFALSVSERSGMIPLADTTPYQTLLGAKYARAA